MKSLQGSFRNLNFSPSTSILLNFFFLFIDISCFFSSLKLQYCRKIVLLNKLKLFKLTSWSCDFPPRKTPVAQKHRAISLQGKIAFPTPPVGLSWDSPPPPPESVRTGGRTLSSQPKFLRSICYQICLAMVLRYQQNTPFLI